jgi:hypothetical protein
MALQIPGPLAELLPTAHLPVDNIAAHERSLAMYRVYRISRKGDRLLLARTSCGQTARRMHDDHDNPWTAIVIWGPEGKIDIEKLPA